MYEIELDDGDVIVMATDGLFDNVWDNDIAALVRNSLEVSIHLDLITVADHLQKCTYFSIDFRCCS